MFQESKLSQLTHAVRNFHCIKVNIGTVAVVRKGFLERAQTCMEITVRASG